MDLRSNGMIIYLFWKEKVISAAPYDYRISRINAEQISRR